MRANWNLRELESIRYGTQLNSQLLAQKAPEGCQITWQQIWQGKSQIGPPKWRPKMKENLPPDHLAASKTPEKEARAKRAPLF